MRPRLELELTYAARRPWVPARAQFLRWASGALTGGLGAVRARARAAVRAGAGSRGGRDPVARRGRDPVARAVLSVRIVGEARSRALNACYRHQNRPTNVLSFEGAGLLPDGRNFLGELVICAPVVAREARSQGKTPPAHWAHMTVHGVLHLLGFDHERDAEAVKMAVREIQILDRLGFSNPYP
jgi:probable rRNA maturation factor